MELDSYGASNSKEPVGERKIKYFCRRLKHGGQQVGNLLFLCLSPLIEPLLRVDFVRLQKVAIMETLHMNNGKVISSTSLKTRRPR